ncbi:MAG: glycoside hydrolase family 9 protein [Chitinophagaceae bacterium]|nr:glycoside hydrolase family 9 protein [Chitinophagaceae bacterium]
MKITGISLLVMIMYACVSYAQTTGIHLNQEGFYPQSRKIAVVTGLHSGNDFFIVSGSAHDTVYRGVLSDTISSAYSSARTRIADFSSLQKEGDYTLLYGKTQSPVFHINKHVLNELSKAALKAYYYQRVSMPLEAQYAGIWSRPAGHKDDSVLIHPSAAGKQRPAGTVLSSPGGWYDAGDYNKYIVNSGITMATLLSAYEDFPPYYKKLYLNIPESGNDIPDILDEVLYNLRWMLTMQDPADGGVYHKCTNAKFDGVVMPGVTKEPRYLVQKSTAATLDFAAVMAQAARVYSKFTYQLPELGDSCLKAALYAWQWAVSNPSVEYNQYEMNKTYSPPVTTGAYGDKFLSDEWFWAAVELSVTTGSTEYIQNKNIAIHITPNVPSWSKADMMGVYTALKYPTVFTGSKLSTSRLLTEMVAFADQLTAGGNKAFKTVMGQSPRDFIWGSNAVAMNQGMLLIKTFLLVNDKKYLEAAASNLDYILGRNATGYCFVTGFGHKSPMHIHHRPSQADGIEAPVPGFLAGGPNPGRQDKCDYEFTETETSYTDRYCSYASNEIAINWNAPLVYVAGAMEKIQNP